MQTVFSEVNASVRNDHVVFVHFPDAAINDCEKMIEEITQVIWFYSLSVLIGKDSQQELSLSVLNSVGKNNEISWRQGEECGDFSNVCERGKVERSVFTCKL